MVRMTFSKPTPQDAVRVRFQRPDSEYTGLEGMAWQHEPFLYPDRWMFRIEGFGDFEVHQRDLLFLLR
jgi:hypothetical protein